MAFNVLYAIVAMAVSFTVSFIATRYWIPLAKSKGLVGKDMNKPGNVMVAEAGGVWAIIGACFGLLVLEALYRYIVGSYYHAAEVFALAAMLILSGFLGFLDDILGWKKGLPRWQRVVFMAPISIPLVVIKAGVSKVELPLVGVIDLGILYPLLAVPIGVLGAANAFNIIGGFNGLEAGMGILLMVFTAIYCYVKHLTLPLYASLIMASSLLGFIVYNWYPARVFPGNSLTYGVGAYYAGIVILGNFEKFGLLLFTLYFVKFALYLRGVIARVWGQGYEDFGVPDSRGCLSSPFKRVYSLQHWIIMLLSRRLECVREYHVVASILALQAIIGVASLLLALYHVV